MAGKEPARRNIRGIYASASLKPPDMVDTMVGKRHIRGIYASASLKLCRDLGAHDDRGAYPRHLRLGLIEA